MGKRYIELYEWYYAKGVDRIYALVGTQPRRWLPPEEQLQYINLLLPDGRLFKMTGRVGRDDAAWIMPGVFRETEPGYSNRHPIRTKGFYLDGRSSLSDIGYGMFTAKVLVEYSPIKESKHE